MGKGKGKFFFFFFFFAEVLNLSGIFLNFFFLSTLDLIKFIKNSCSLNSPLYIRVIYIYIYIYIIYKTFDFFVDILIFYHNYIYI